MKTCVANGFDLGSALALRIARVDALQLCCGSRRPTRFPFARAANWIVGLFVATWATSALVWKVTRLEERWAPMSFGSSGSLMKD